MTTSSELKARKSAAVPNGVGTKGKPPLTLTLPIGKHTARISRTAERGEEMAIDVKKGETVILEAP